MTKQEERDLYGCTLAMYKGRIRSAVRKLWMYSKGRKDALIRSRYETISERYKWLETCANCRDAYRIGQKEFTTLKNGKQSKKKRPCLVVHHIEPVPDVFHEKFLINMFCEQHDNPADGYLVLCHDCHTKVHEELDNV
jgi:hypothetical protein